MTARNQLLVVLTALMLVCSSGAMVVGATPATTVDEDTTADDGEYDESDEATASDDEPDDVSADEDEDSPAETAPGEDQDAHVTFSDQTTDGETVVVDEVTMASGGFVTIHDSNLLAGNAIESVIGSSEYLEPGTHENVEVTLEEPLEEDETLIAMPHRDTNDNEEYDFVETEGEEDGPYLTADDEPVTDDAVVTVGEPAEEESAEEPIEEDPAEEPVEETPVEEDPAKEPVEETPVEEDPAEEPVEEEPEAVEDDVIDIVIEQATIYVFVGELPDDMPADENDVGVDSTDDESGVDDSDDMADDEPGVDDSDDMADDEPGVDDSDDMADDESGVDDSDDTADDESDVDDSDDTVVDDGVEHDDEENDVETVEINIVINELTIIPVDDHQDADMMPGMDDEADEEDTADLEDEGDAVTAADEGMPVDTIEDGEIVIEEVTIFVLIEDVNELLEEEFDGTEEESVDTEDATDAEPTIGVAGAH